MLAGLVNEIRRVGWLYESAHSKKKVPQPEWVRPPWAEDERDRDVIKGDSFESPEAAADWYAARFPERADEVRALAGIPTSE